jgi:hypothetical protein
MSKLGLDPCSFGKRLIMFRVVFGERQVLIVMRTLSVLQVHSCLLGHFIPKLFETLMRGANLRFPIFSFPLIDLPLLGDNGQLIEFRIFEKVNPLTQIMHFLHIQRLRPQLQLNLLKLLLQSQTLVSLVYLLLEVVQLLYHLSLKNHQFRNTVLLFIQLVIELLFICDNAPVLGRFGSVSHSYGCLAHLRHYGLSVLGVGRALIVLSVVEGTLVVVPSSPNDFRLLVQSPFQLPSLFYLLSTTVKHSRITQLLLSL